MKEKVSTTRVIASIFEVDHIVTYFHETEEDHTSGRQIKWGGRGRNTDH